jgi:hypothetical protein
MKATSVIDTIAVESAIHKKARHWFPSVALRTRVRAKSHVSSGRWRLDPYSTARRFPI